ncbi:MAG: hypothetical protein ACRD68_13645, partial [Pyrinomonadaceae bacterium]
MKADKHIAPTVLSVCVIFSLLLYRHVAGAQSVRVADGLNYLRTAQNADGSWGGTPSSLNGVFPTTAAALEALRAVEPAPSTNQTGAVQYLGSQTAAETSSLAARVIALGGAGVAADVDALIVRQNADGGWGTDAGGESDALDTSLALLAL